MFAKLASLLALAAMLGASAPKAPHQAQTQARNPTAAVRLCLGPVRVNFATPAQAPVMLDFSPDHPCRGVTGLVEWRRDALSRAVKKRPSGGEFPQKLPSLPHSLP